MYHLWRVYSTFLTGLLIGLSYALLIGNPIPSNANGIAGLIEWPVLVLTFSGILGGVIYSIVIDGKVEMPRFVAREDALFKAGLFGDILLGIAGAFILELLLPATLSGFEPASLNANPSTNLSANLNANSSGSAIAAVGIIGGYGGRAVIKFSLERFFKSVGSLDDFRTEARTQTRTKPTERQRLNPPPEDGSADKSWEPASKASSEAASETASDHSLALIEQIDDYILGQLPDSAWRRLSQQLQASSASDRKAIFTALVDLREIKAANGLTPDQLQRMIPIFEELMRLEPNAHPFCYQLALIYQDSQPPDYGSALTMLDRAIAQRGPLAIAQPWQYELHRAMVTIHQGQAESVDFNLSESRQTAILADLLAIEKVYNLDTILRAAYAQQIPTIILDWLRDNQALLAKRAETKSLMARLRPVIQGNLLQSTGAARPSVVPEVILETTPEVTPQVTSEVTVSPKATATNPPIIAENSLYSALGRGYDILSLDPFNISGAAPTTPVFEFPPGAVTPVLDEGETLLIPKGTRHSPRSKGSLKASTQTRLMYSESDVQKMLASSLGGSVVRLLGAVLPCSLSASYASIKQERKTERSVYAFTQAEYVDYALEIPLASAAALHLSEAFQSAVARLPLAVTYGYHDLIYSFGTHVSIKVEFGGLLYHRLRLKHSVYDAAVQRGADVALEAQKIFQAKLSNQQQGRTFQETTDSSESLDFCGGNFKGNIHDWFATVKSDPAPIHLELVPLHDLLTQAFFPADSQIAQKRSLLAAATQHYLENNSQPPDWELWPSAAVGGNGGEAFSDMDIDFTLVEVNQAGYQKARVTEVRVWIKNWINQVQIVLEGDTAPLPVHGNESGDCQIFRLDPGDYITAVAVMPGSPQKILVDRGTYVGSLSLRTHQGKVWTVGKPDSRAIALDIPEGYQVIGFHGRCGKYIDKLGVISMPILT